MASSYGARRAAARHDQIFSKCPRCRTNLLHPTPVRNALSRKDNETYICSDCGTDEAMRDAFGYDAWPNFPDRLGDGWACTDE